MKKKNYYNKKLSSKELDLLAQIINYDENEKKLINFINKEKKNLVKNIKVIKIIPKINLK